MIQEGCRPWHFCKLDFYLQLNGYIVVNFGNKLEYLAHLFSQQIQFDLEIWSRERFV